MKLELRNNKDFWAGVMFFATGAIAVFAARNYPIGTTLRMGPGYFPILLGGIMIAFGLVIMLKGLRKSEKIQSNWSMRALILLPFSMMVYGILMDFAGFIPALMALIFVSAASGREFKVKEVLLLTAVLVLMSWSLFILGLGLPYPLLNKFW